MAMKLRILQEGFLPSDQEAVVERQTSSALLLRFTHPFQLRETTIEYAVAQVRHKETSFDGLEKGTRILCNITAIPSEEAKSDDPFDLSWWRGGNAAITDVIAL